MAGAGNKLNLYLKAQLPSIVPNSLDFVGLLNKYPMGKIARTNEPGDIAYAVNEIFDDDFEYSEMCRQAARAFVDEYHFEKQFEPVLRWIECIR